MGVDEGERREWARELWERARKRKREGNVRVNLLVGHNSESEILGEFIERLKCATLNKAMPAEWDDLAYPLSHRFYQAVENK